MTDMQQNISQYIPNASLKSKTLIEEFYTTFCLSYSQEYGYGEGHLVLAAHAAFCPFITVDLLYKLWQNFSTYPDEAGKTKLIDPVAVPDILFSPICKERGTKQFEMLKDVKLGLISLLTAKKWLWHPNNPFGEKRKIELGEFFYEYANKTYIADDEISIGAKQDLEWTADFYLDSRQSLLTLGDRLFKAIKENDEAEQIRLCFFLENLNNLNEATTDIKSSTQDLKNVLTYGRGLLHFLSQDYDKASQILNDIPFTSRKSSKGINLPIPKNKLNLIEDPLEKLIRINRKNKSSSLDLSNFQLNNIPSSITQLIWLEKLDLSNSGVTDISRLSVLSKLKSLNLSQNPISSISSLVKLNQLTSLDLSQTKVADLEPLANLIHLSSLSINNTPVKDLSPISGLIELTSLSLNSSDVSDLTPISGLKQLNVLSLNSTDVSDLTPISMCKQLKALYLDSTLVSDLSPLSELIKLTSLSLNSSDVSDLTPISGLKNLYVLSLNSTPVNNLGPLSELIKLNSLFLNSTIINDLIPLTGLNQLCSIDLGSTQISDLSALKGFNFLRKLATENARISRIESWLVNLPSIRELHLRGNLIYHLPYEIINQQNCYEDLYRWFKDLEESSIINAEIKVILLGNGRVGKSSILNRLTNMGFLDDQSSTHGIQLITYPTDITLEDGVTAPLTLNYWDFGGQDIYHGTHRIFMQSRALFLLIWDWPGETDRHISAEEEEADGYMYRNHILPHWLDYIQTLSKDSPVIIVQNKIDAHRTKPVPYQEAIEEIYDVRYFHHVSAKNGRGIGDLKEIIKEVIQEMPEWHLEMPGSWHKLRLVIREKAKSQTDITKEDFEDLCEEAGVKEVSRPSLLRYLHDTGVVFHRKDLFHGRIILDQQWAIKAVYSLFNRQDLFWYLLSRENGQFDFKMLALYWQQQEGFSEEKSRLALSFMLNGEICYRLNAPDKDKGEEDLYIVPQLLPEELPIQRRQLWPINGLFLRFEYQYLHQVFIHRLIVRTSKLSHPENVWKRGIWFLWENTHALIQAQEDSQSAGGYIQLQVSGPKEEELLRRIRKEFDMIHPKGVNHTCVVSLDGSGWVNLEEIDSARKNQLEEFVSSNGEKIDPRQYAVFFEEKKDIEDKKDKRTKAKEGGIQDLEPTHHAPLSAELVSKWKEQVAKNQIELVIDAMFPYIVSNDLAIQTSARYYELQTQIQSGTVSEADKAVLKNKLTESVLFMIKEFENQIL